LTCEPRRSCRVLRTFSCQFEEVHLFRRYPFRMQKTHILGLVLVLGLVLTACSANSGTPSVASLESRSEDVVSDTGSSDSDPVADAEEAMLAFTQCLRDEGIDIDDPTVDSDGNLQLAPIEFAVEGGDAGADPELSHFDDLIAPCQELLAGMVTTGSNNHATEFEDAMLEYAQCMRTNGVDMPDPDFSSGGGIVDLGMIDGDSAAFAHADEQCRDLLSLLGSVGAGS
jgi:hypothetical protein